MSNIIFKPLIPTIIMIIICLLMIGITIINHKNIVTRIIIVILIFIISQRPMIKNGAALTYNLDIDVLFVIDNTMSMNAVDVNNETRLQAVIKDCKYIIDQMPGANFAIITFNNYSQIKVPFTFDAQIGINVINNLQIVDPSYATGSTLMLPYEDMQLLLKSSNSKYMHHRVIFFISDGELTNTDKLALDLDKYKELRDLIDDGAILGYGSEEGAKMLVTDGINLQGMIDENNYLLDKSKTPAEPAISKLDENNLQYLANTLDIDYIHMTSTDSIKNKLNNIKKNAILIEKENSTANEDIYYLFTGLLLIALLYELYNYRRSEQ